MRDFDERDLQYAMNLEREREGERGLKITDSIIEDLIRSAFHSSC